MGPFPSAAKSVLCDRKPAANRRSIIGLTMATAPRICHVSRLPVTTPLAPPMTSAIPSLFPNRSSGCVGEATISEKTPNYRLRLRSVLSTGHGPVGIMGPRDAICKSLGNTSPLPSPLTVFYICFEAVNNLLACTNVAVETFWVYKLIAQTTEK